MWFAMHRSTVPTWWGIDENQPFYNLQNINQGMKLFLKITIYKPAMLWQSWCGRWLSVRHILHWRSRGPWWGERRKARPLADVGLLHPQTVTRRPAGWTGNSRSWRLGPSATKEQLISVLLPWTLKSLFMSYFTFTFQRCQIVKRIIVANCCLF